ncbi:hypothetical protein K1719_003688 [Acacia pycnantha]|nr:hypothetical protein K1719_003688 [Acacia pycnantha]
MVLGLLDHPSLKNSKGIQGSGEIDTEGRNDMSDDSISDPEMRILNLYDVICTSKSFSGRNVKYDQDTWKIVHKPGRPKKRWKGKTGESRQPSSGSSLMCFTRRLSKARKKRASKESEKRVNKVGTIVFYPARQDCAKKNIQETCGEKYTLVKHWWSGIIHVTIEIGGEVTRGWVRGSLWWALQQLFPRSTFGYSWMRPNSFPFPRHAPLALPCSIGGGLPFILTAVYATPQENLKQILWQSLLNFSLSMSMPWVVFGDFSDVLSPSERIGGSGSNDFRMNLFYDRLHACKLSDMGSSGPKFTWKGPRLRGCRRHFERLDSQILSSFCLSPNALFMSFQELNSLITTRSACGGIMTLYPAIGCVPLSLRPCGSNMKVL